MSSEYNIKKWKQYKLITLDDGEVNMISKKIGDVRGWSSSLKSLPAMTAAIIQTLYKLGPKLTMRPKDMVNDTTRLAYLLDKTSVVSVDNLLKRGQVSCGHDEFEGKASTFYQMEYKFSKKEEIFANYDKYDWKKVGAGKFIRADTSKEMEELKEEHYLKEQKRLLEKYDLVDYKFPEGVERTAEMYFKKYMFNFLRSSYDTSSSFRYRLFDDKYSYKGECAWKDNKDKRCSFHNGLQYEMVLIDKKGKRLSDIENLSDWLQTKCTDDDVIKAIKKAIPKMKTESRDWLMSTWGGRDEEGKWIHNLHGTRGHYKLTWWSSIEAMKKAQEDSVIYKARDGTLLNGWRFKAIKSHYSSNNYKGEWVPVTPLKKYSITYEKSYSTKVLLTTFDRDTAEQLVQFLSSLKPNFVSDRMVVEGKVIIPVSLNKLAIREDVLDIHLEADADPSKYTPTQALALIRSGDEGHRRGNGDIQTDMYIEGGR